MQRSFIREILEAIDSQTISFAGGLPDEKLFPKKELGKSSKRIFKNSSNLQYNLSKGIPELRKIIADLYNRDNFKTTSENILITTGSQQGLYLISNYFKNKDILVENPSYLGAINVFKSNNLNLKSIVLENDGIDIKSFENEYKNSNLAYLIPDFQNPKASLYSNKKRNSISKIVNKYGGYIIEDSPYSELYYEEKKKSISSLIPNNSFHLGSFSKTLSPAFRIGWIRANKEIIEKLVVIKEIIDLHTCSISQYILTDYLKDEKNYRLHLDLLRKEYKKKMNYFADIIEEKIPNFEFTRPKGGMFIYGKLKGYDTSKLVKKAIENKVVYVPGSEFYIDKKVYDEIRFNFTHSRKKDIKEGIKRLKKLFDKK